MIAFLNTYYLLHDDERVMGVAVRRFSAVNDPVWMTLMVLYIYSLMNVIIL